MKSQQHVIRIFSALSIGTIENYVARTKILFNLLFVLYMILKKFKYVDSFQLNYLYHLTTLTL